MRSRVGPIGGAILLGGFLAASSCRDSDAGNGEGTGGRIEPGPAWQNDGRLPTAFVDVPYSLELTLPGLDPEVAHWRVSSGSLPDGLALNESGIVAGVPEREGEARFTLRAEAEAQVVVRPVRLTVSRKRWVAYLSDEQALGQHLLYLVDLGGSLPRTKLVTRAVHSRSEVLPDHYRFAPADEALAYLVDATRDGVRELYAVDLSGGRIGQPVRVDQGGHVHSFAWSPDARSIAYVSEREGHMHAYVVPWPFEGARFDLGMAGGQGRISWVHSHLLIFEATRTTSAVVRRRDRNRFEVTSRVPQVGQVIQATGERVVLGEDFYLCAGSRHFLDLTREPATPEPGLQEGEHVLGAALHHAPGLTRSALVEGNTLRILSEHRELDRVPLGSCDAVSWSSDGSSLLSVDEHRRLRVSELGGDQVTHRLVDGDYDAVVDWPRPELDESGRWLKFHDSRGLHLSQLVEGRPTRAVPIHDRVTLPGAAIRESTFVPGGLVFVARAGSRAELVRLDLRNVDLESRTLALFEEGNGPMPLRLVGGLTDGSWLGLLVQNGEEQGNSERPVSLWVGSLQGTGAARAELLAPSLECVPKAASVKMASGRGPAGAAIASWRCETVSDVVFQP